MVSTNIMVNELNRMFLDFNAMMFDSQLPEVEIVIQRKGKHKAYGWFTMHKVWTSEKHEITITAEHLDRGCLAIAETLLHEMVHLSNSAKGIEDCSRGGTYHNEKFAKEAQRIGLVVKKGKSGFSNTELSDGLKARIEGLKYIDVFKVRRHEEGSKGGTGKTGNIIKYVCPDCGQIARGSKEIFVICGHCNVTMLKA